MGAHPLLSIIIPTKNRAPYVGPCVRGLLSSSAEDLEVVVQDNSDDDSTAEAVAESADDPRLQYVHSRRALDMRENFTCGLEASAGEYVCFLGDDDGVNREFVDAVRWARGEGVDSLSSPILADYKWPDVSFVLYGAKFSSSLSVKPFSGVATFTNMDAELRSCVQRAGAGFGRLPKVYHGAVRRDRLGALRDRIGTCFPGPTPDMASAVALASFVARPCHLDYPLVISGTGRSSGGGAGTRKKHEWSLEDVPWFPPDAIANWSALVPRVCCGPTLWAEDVVQALRATGHEELLGSYNLAKLHGRCVAFNPNSRAIALANYRRLVRDDGRGTGMPSVRLGYYFLQAWTQRFLALVENCRRLTGLSTTHMIRDLLDIRAATDALADWLGKRGHSFDRCL